MSKKDPAPEETSTEPEKPTKEEAKPEDIEEPLDEMEEPPVEEKKPKRKKATKKRAKLSVLQAAVLETIRERPQRPRAIQTIISSAGGVDIPRNEIIRSLNELRDKGLVEKITAKAWQAN
jgi:outer membrane biosynthesis protein TonB